MDHRWVWIELPGLRRCLPQQNRYATGIDRALQVDVGIAREPHRPSRLDAGTLQRQLHRMNGGLVARGIEGADDAPEIPVPAQVRCLLAQMIAFLVADDGQVEAAAMQILQEG